MPTPHSLSLASPILAQAQSPSRASFVPGPPSVRRAASPPASSRGRLSGVRRNGIVCLLAVALPVLAQPTGVDGSTTDASNRPLASVDIELRDAGGQVIARTRSDARGRFSVPPPGPGDYVLIATKAGFLPATRTIRLPLASQLPIALALPPGRSESIVVEAPWIAGPGLSPAGGGDYAVRGADIANLAAGTNTPLSDVLSHMPGVAIDQNQQVHIRNTEGPQFQYQINGTLVPLDINTNPPFLSMINVQFIKQMDLLVGVLPARYGYATGGVVDIQTKDGCSQPAGSAAILVGQRETVSPSAQYAGCSGRFGYYVNGLYSQSNTAFSSATPGPSPIHDRTHQGQGFGVFTYDLPGQTKLSLVTSAAASNNELPNVPNLPPAFALAGAGQLQSANINSSLDFRDALAILAVTGPLSEEATYKVAYTAHFISQRFNPDAAGELVFQGVASTASHVDRDQTLQGDLTLHVGSHQLSAGGYFGVYHVDAMDSSLVFPVDAAGNQTSDVPISVATAAAANNVVTALHVNDVWLLGDRLRANLGLRWDDLTGFTRHDQVDPTVNLSTRLNSSTTLHAGFARTMQVPSFQGISPNAPEAFAGTTAAGPPGVPNPLTEDDLLWDVGAIHDLRSGIIIALDNYYEQTRHYLDTGQFGVVPIFAPFNYDHGYVWGTELALACKGDHASAYANVTVGRNSQIGVVTGQFNFPSDELAYIDSHHIVLDHQPLVGISAGVTVAWKPYSFSLDALYSSGLRAGFADLERLPSVFQVNLGVQRAFRVRGVGEVANRLTVLNLLDRINLIRPAQGIGIFQAAYGPRLTVLDALTIPF